MTTHKHLFGTKRDFEPGIARIEEQLELRYVLCTFSEKSEITSYLTLLDYEDLGVNRSGDHLTPAILIVPRTASVHVETVPQRGGGNRFSISQSGNTGSIVFQPGGIYQENALVAGHISTIHQDTLSTRLFADFSRALLRGFRKVRSYRVGPEALQLLDGGTRLLTINAREPQEYDLKR